MDWYLKCLSNYATFSGRARRKEYWMFYLVNLIIGCGLTIAGYALTWIFQWDFFARAFNAVYWLYTLVILVPSLAVCVRRLHDIGKSGWYYLLIFIPLVGAIILLVWFCTDGTPGINQYGPDPKNRGGFGGGYPGSIDPGGYSGGGYAGGDGEPLLG